MGGWRWVGGWVGGGEERGREGRGADECVVQSFNFQLESLAGSAHVPNDNACVLRWNVCVQKPQCDQKVNSLLALYIVSTITNHESSRDALQ